MSITLAKKCNIFLKTITYYTKKEETLMQNRTDLALELKEEKNIGSAESGIIVKTRIDTANHIKETKIIIKIKKEKFLLENQKGVILRSKQKICLQMMGVFIKK